MTRTILFIVVLLVASPVVLALDPIVSKTTAEELVEML